MKRLKAKDLLTFLRKEPIKTWFDLTLFLDRIKDERPVPCTPSFKTLGAFKEYVRKGGIGFVTFYTDIDGVTIEKVKYARSLEYLLHKDGKRDVPVHWISGRFNKDLLYFADKSIPKYCLPAIDGFDRWGDPYFKLFHTKLERGSKEYNELPPVIWEQTLDITRKLASYIEKNQIRLLLCTNTHSNPGNMALALSIVLVTELMGIPVIASNHDFYWEGGKAKKDRAKGEPAGMRDHFFLNADIGEVFSFQQVLYPWESRTWLHMNINSSQSKTLVEKIGISPANVMEMTTAVDTSFYKPLTPAGKSAVYAKMNRVLRRYGTPATVTPDHKTLTEFKPVVFGPKAGVPFEFSDDTMILLQPTRIIRRKRIEFDIDLLEKMLHTPRFRKATTTKQLVFFVTGPVAPGHTPYLRELQARVRKLYKSLDAKLAEHVRVVMFFGTRIESFRVDDPNSIVIPELYGVARLVLLPSETEGRGLPIIESSSAGVPIAPSRYRPEQVFVEVVGENRPADERLEVLEFPEGNIPQSFVDRTLAVVMDDRARERIVKHNRAVIQKRYSYPAMRRMFNDALRRLWLQMRKDPKELPLAKDALATVHPRPLWKNRPADVDSILYADTKSYLPGYAVVGFLLYLKSLIDPSYFRAEEQELRSRLFAFAQDIAGGLDGNERQMTRFYNSICRMFLVTDGKEHIGIDHSFNYRHRTRTFYPYRDFTEQELQGAIVHLARQSFGTTDGEMVATKAKLQKTGITEWRKLASSLRGWKKCAGFLVGDSGTPAVDDTDMLAKRLSSPSHTVHICGCGGAGLIYDLKILAEMTLTEWSRNTRGKGSFSVTFAAKADPFGHEATVKDIRDLLKAPGFGKLRTLQKKGLFKIVATGSLSSGTNLYQASPSLIRAMKRTNRAGGFVTARGENNYFTLALLDVDAFWYGRMNSLIGSKISGFKQGASYCMYVPAGMRPTLAYPTPVQNAVEFAEFFRSGAFKKLVDKHGLSSAMAQLKELSGEGLPIKGAMKKIRKDKSYSGPVRYSEISGIYSDGLPWTGAIGIAEIEKRPLKFILAQVEKRGDTVVDMVRRHKKRTGEVVEIAWNGGYILNAELVGKLGLPETYIGTPLGLLIQKGQIKCLPLFSKPAFGAKADGSIVVARVELSKGSVAPAGRAKGKAIEWDLDQINPGPSQLNSREIAVYSLMYGRDDIPAKGRVVIEVAGDHVTKVVRDVSETRLSPIGITISVPAKAFDRSYATWCKRGRKLQFTLDLGPEWDGVVSAVEAGPLLMDRGRTTVDMEGEGWNLEASIRIQAARLDRTDLRGPKIGVGITNDGDVVVVTVNGRTRDSVGATYHDLASILKQHDVATAMGFDPGGSTTLVTHGVQRNISPYNKDYEKDVYTLPPQARGVTNAILGIMK